MQGQTDRFLRRGAENSIIRGQTVTLRDGRTFKTPDMMIAIPAAGTINVMGGELTEAAALANAEEWLGPGYTEIAPGVYRSADNLRQFRMTNKDLLDPAQGPHVHFEAIGPDGRVRIENSHVKLKP